MKTKLVLWGRDEEDKKVLMAVSLTAAENKVETWAFDGDAVTESFSNDLMKKWRIGEEMEFEIESKRFEKELTVTESMLPDGYKADRPDIVQRAQTEWHFVVLSARLYNTYTTELEDLKERIDKVDDFSKDIWEDLKGFWSKVQHQIREKNLFRDHIYKLKDETNELFTKMKDMRGKMEDQFREQSKVHMDEFMERFGEIEKRIEEGLNLSVLFDDLKKAQRAFRDTKFTKEHRTKVWNRMDTLFKEVKKRKFGDKPQDATDGVARVQRRLDGLVNAIDKMKKSIARDHSELEFQGHKISTSGGQLEAQIRQAKVKMIEERIRSKEEKLGQMEETLKKLEVRLAKEKKRATKRQEKLDIEKEKEKLKQQIADDIKSAEASREDDADKLKEAAEAIKGKQAAEEKQQASQPSALEEIGNMLSDTLEDVVDTVKAVAHVVEDKVEEMVEDLKGEEE